MREISIGTRRINPYNYKEEVYAAVPVKGRDGKLKTEKKWVPYEKGKGLKAIDTLLPPASLGVGKTGRKKGIYIVDDKSKK